MAYHRPHYSGWVVNHGDPERAVTMLPRPRRAVVTAETYGGRRMRLQLYVIARAPGYVCVRQDLPGRAPWNAWLPEAQALPVG